MSEIKRCPYCKQDVYGETARNNVEQNKKLNALISKMQADVTNYLIPDKTECNKDWLVSRLIYWLDGPEQRDAQNIQCNHKWDRDGERCVICGDKDWMQ